MPEKKLPALTKAMNFLAMRPLSELELLAKLRKAGYPDFEADAAIEECKKRHYLDDTLLANDCVDILHMRNMGTRQIKQKLLKRGLDAETINEKLSQTSEDELEAAQRALETKLRMLRNEKDPRRKREKLFRFLNSRGFAPGLIFSLLDKIALTSNEDEYY